MTKKPKINDIDKQRIKQKYLSGEKPTDIIQNYLDTEITLNTIYNWIRNEKWNTQKQSIKPAIEKAVDKEISRLTGVAMDKLEYILKNSKTESSLIAAARAILDISGLKTSNINDSRKKAVDKDTLEAIEKQLGLDYKANKKA